MASEGVLQAFKTSLEPGYASLYTTSAVIDPSAPSGCIQIWTIQLAQWRKAKQAGLEILNITAKSGVQAFAPDFAVVMQIKRGEISEEAYAEAYLTRMRQSYRTLPQMWLTLAHQPVVALACYCDKEKFCHRHLFAAIMHDYLVSKGHSVQLKGELW